MRRAVADALRAPVTTARVAAWAWAGARRLRRGLRVDGMDAVGAVPPSPAVPDHHRAVVVRVLRATGDTCLVGAALLQRWDADHGRDRELVIGVSREEDGVAAHAWLAGDAGGRGFVELHRRPPAATDGVVAPLSSRRPRWTLDP